ncbi:DNA polymerase subunit gamma-1-like [Uloborus diversus]|uniref:DNA polymerase subunit gamma-1-like n=1 Tax=Uloborus diversus TaxID=327109 RepID=UPI002409E941|nr:DNA polymerase subunit gamma-1-like [Uloborus diversus]
MTDVNGYCNSLYKSGESKNLPTRFNEINIQMLSAGLHHQIFGKCDDTNVDTKTLEKVVAHLSEHNLWKAETSTLPEVQFTIPDLHNSNIIDHFHHIACQLLSDYKTLLFQLTNATVPPVPTEWEFVPGWTQYDHLGNSKKVDFPEDGALVFDVEVCMQEGNFPTIASAVSDKHWYLWCSERLIQNQFVFSKEVSLSDLIPLETLAGSVKPPEEKKWSPRLIIGHNVAFDRTFIKEQYFLEKTKAMFLDTMSLHMCVSGLTGLQRAMSVALKKNGDSTNDFFNAVSWSYISSLNNLADVYDLYCQETLDKTERAIFVSGSLNDVKDNFQVLASYCASDTLATLKILKKIMPMYLERFPHPVTLYGLLEMSTAYLPVNQNWSRYLYEAQSTYDDLQKELKLSLVHLANDAASLLHNDLYKNDPWLWDLDWSVQSIKFKKDAPQPKKKKKKIHKDADKISKTSKEEEKVTGNKSSEVDLNEAEKEVHPNDSIDPSLQKMYDSAASLRKIRPFLPGYPAWYRELCDRNETDPDWEPGPHLISTQMRCVPKLMRMVWDGCPLHYDSKHGWGYLVPTSEVLSNLSEAFPLKNFHKILGSSKDLKHGNQNIDFLWSKIKEPQENRELESKIWQLILQNKKKTFKSSETHNEIGPHDVGISGCAFYRLPHKDGPHKRVGNPLSKDFLPKVEDGTLKTWGETQADRALLLSKMLSYWKNSHARIMSQMVVWLNATELNQNIKQSDKYDENNSYGAILPRLIPAGTVTRRAVEPTWLTASNAYEDRVGSELKSMVQAPPGYHFVGADVDSQELWLAALFGDSQFAKIHGCTAFGWMTLQGKKSTGTDMHSRTAKSVGIARDQAKILNYARIYGAGKSFAQRLLTQFNHRLTPEEAKIKVKKIYAETKGVQKFAVSEDNVENNGFVFTPGGQKRIWVGGSESHMFNKLEEIALSSKPCTPALNCRISRALEPRAVDKNFMTSRINWVVQSSAVDFLHLMLVCMRWLFEEFSIQGRFVICIHDEVRYLVKSEDRYRASLALQITNLLTRSFFVSKEGMNDLPQSVAFFSSVDIDTVLRKEVHMDSVTPSNPHGLQKGYGIPPGEALDIFEIICKTNGGHLHKDKESKS